MLAISILHRVIYCLLLKTDELHVVDDPNPITSSSRNGAASYTHSQPPNLSTLGMSIQNANNANEE